MLYDIMLEFMSFTFALYPGVSQINGRHSRSSSLTLSEADRRWLLRRIKGFQSEPSARSVRDPRIRAACGSGRKRISMRSRRISNQ